jgi:hypothetical protein
LCSFFPSKIPLLFPFLLGYHLLDEPGVHAFWYDAVEINWLRPCQEPKLKMHRHLQSIYA